MNKYAFIDEHGNFGFDFDKEGVSTHFIVTAILVEEDHVDSLKVEVENIRRKHFQTGEMKSSTVSNNDNKRIAILKDLQALNFNVFAVVIDKRLLSQEGGLGYKRSFHKFLNGKVHSELFRTFPHLIMVADEHGSKEFMKGFISYVTAKHIPRLFTDSEFGFANSKDTILIQLADFICGTIAKRFDEKRKSINHEQLFELIQDKIVGLREWPQSFESFKVDFGKSTSTEFNPTIMEQSINLAQQFIEKNKDVIKPSVRDQVNFLKFLLLNLRFEQFKYVSTREIIRNMNFFRGKQLTVQNIRTNIVARLRDEGVIIASSEMGYKLAVSDNDLYDYANHSRLMIKPMLSRLEKCRQHILLATLNKFDILDKPEFEDLKMFLEINSRA